MLKSNIKWRNQLLFMHSLGEGQVQKLHSAVSLKGNAFFETYSHLIFLNSLFNSESNGISQVLILNIVFFEYCFKHDPLTFNLVPFWTYFSILQTNFLSFYIFTNFKRFNCNNPRSFWLIVYAWHKSSKHFNLKWKIIDLCC